jgi:type II secretory pathway pseudopilin PulG
LSIVVTVIGIVVAVLAIGITRQSRRDRRVLRSLSAEDCQFIADQFELFTRLPLGTAEDEDAWQEARDATFERLGERVPDFAREVLPRFLPYFNDADIFRREPDYRAAQERRFVDFIRELRAQPTKT